MVTAPPLEFELQLRLDAGDGLGSSWRIDDVQLDVAPVVILAEPDSAVAGEDITISAPGLGPDTAVLIGGNPAPVVSVEPGRLVVTIPELNGGQVAGELVPIETSDLAGGSLVEPAGFRYREPLVIGELLPAVVSSAGGTRVRVAGGGLPNTFQLAAAGIAGQAPIAVDLIGAAPADGSEWRDSFEFTADLQGGLAGLESVAWQMLAPDGTDIPGGRFTVHVEAPPALGALSPESGPPLSAAAARVGELLFARVLAGAEFDPVLVEWGDGDAQLAITGAAAPLIEHRFPAAVDSRFVVEWSTDGRSWSVEGVTLSPRPDLGGGEGWSFYEASMPVEGRARILVRVRAESCCGLPNS